MFAGNFDSNFIEPSRQFYDPVDQEVSPDLESDCFCNKVIVSTTQMIKLDCQS